LKEGVVDEHALAKAARGMQIAFVESKVFLNKQDVTDAMRTETCSMRASEVAKLAGVRSALLDRQRAFRQPPGLVADGRDMGTVVFPDAALKVFLTASPEVRAERRYKQLIEKGMDANLRALSRDLKERDARDANRAVAPLVPAEDSQVVDSTALSIDEVVGRILDLHRERTGGFR
jgi:cytidylate kinase